jgi:hypothetical protein
MARKEKQFHYLYKIANTKNGKYYIGMHSTDNIEDGYLGSGRLIRNSIRSHGKDAHTKEILEYFDDRESLRKKEIDTVNDDLLSDPMCMNLMIGGDGGYISVENQRARSIGGGKAFAKMLKCNPEALEKLRQQSRLNINNANYPGRDYNTFEGKSHTEEAKRSIGIKNSINQKGEKNSQFGTRWINNGNVNKKIKSEDLDNYLNNGWSTGRV